jgi:DHA1 family bicyclomycin/chloramphenicol resistance-like MFS transporter
LAAEIGLPTTFKPDTSISLKPKPIITNFLTIIKEPQFYTYAFAGSIAFSDCLPMWRPPYFFIYGYFKVDKTYGWIFAFMSLSFIMESIKFFLLKSTAVNK